jgi:predicted acylesterase/phospholipase RssA
MAIDEALKLEKSALDSDASGSATPKATSVPRRHQPHWHNYTAFVLSGGGARGALQVGMLKALLEHGEHPDVLVGTSVGAWNGTWLARQPTLAGIASLENVWRTLKPVHVLLGREPAANTPSQVLRGMLMIAAARHINNGYPSLYSNAGLHQLLDRHLSDLTFESLALPLRVVATNLTSGKRTIFTNGPLAPALLASAAIPGVFPPVRIEDDMYVDGGAVDNTNLDIAIQMGARRLFILDVGYDATGEGESLWDGIQPGDLKRGQLLSANLPHAVAAVLERTTQVVSRYHLQHSLEHIPPGIEVHVLRASTPGGGGALDFARAPEWMERGYLATNQYLRTHSRRHTHLQALSAAE